MRRSITLFVVIVGLAAWRASHAAAKPVPPAKASAPRVTLRSQCEVTPARPVAVRDIADIRASAEITRRIGEVTVTTAPMPGAKRTIDTSFIKLRLAAAELPQAVTVTGPSQITLVGKSIRITAQELEDKAKELLQQQLPQDNRIYDISPRSRATDLTVAFGTTVEIRPRLLNPTLRPGTNAVSLDVVIDGKVATSTTVSMQVTCTAQVLVTTDSVRQGDPLTDANTVWEQRDVSRLPNAMTPDEWDSHKGAVARRTISRGTIITGLDISQPLTVRRGDSVAVTVKCGPVTLHTMAEAKQDGRIGETIRVRSTIADEDVRARIVEPGLVEITR